MQSDIVHANGKSMEIYSASKLLANNVNKQVAAKMDGKK